MARNLKQKHVPGYLFDQLEAAQSLVSEEKPGIFRRFFLFIKNRYALLAIIFLVMGSLILLETAKLQLNPSVVSGVVETSGVARQIPVSAPRGDIVDASGQALAYTRPVTNLMISYAGLDALQFNQLLLDLSYLLDQYEVDWHNPLAEYLQLTDEKIDLNFSSDDAGPAVFLLDWPDIYDWQTKTGPFGLKDDAKVIATVDNNQVKHDAEQFFDYLRYTVFQIEQEEAAGFIYSRREAYRIMGLRYLIYEQNWSFINGQPVELAVDIDERLVQLLNEQNYRFPGLLTTLSYQRLYTENADLLSHVLGYVGPISAEQYYQWQNQGYLPDALVGQSGVEASAERYLAGLDGIKPYNIWSVAGENGTFFSEKIGRDAVPGYNVRLTIDLKLQQVAKTALIDVIEEIQNSKSNKNRGDADAGAVVMLNVKTGAVLAMASYPDYRPADFLDQADDQEAARRVKEYLTDQTAKPMLNRAMMEIYAPGSTFKPATVVAALETETITPSRNIIRCKGREVIGDWLWYCLERPNSGHGDLNLTRAIATSCNLYFFNLGVRTGIDAIDYWGEQLGLGTITGIDIPGEVRGYRANRENKKLLRKNPEDQIWFPADTCQSAIGQFDNSFTILQLATYAAALATGERVTPYVIDTVTRQDGVIIKQNTPQPQPLDLKADTLAAVRQGMIAVAGSRDGTAWRYFHDFPIQVAAKTGTAETGFEDRSSSNGLFICYAPADDPEVAIAQIIEKGAWGSNTIRIAKELLTAYFDLDPDYNGWSQTKPGISDLEVDFQPDSERSTGEDDN